MTESNLIPAANVANDKMMGDWGRVAFSSNLSPKVLSVAVHASGTWGRCLQEKAVNRGTGKQQLYENGAQPPLAIKEELRCTS